LASRPDGRILPETVEKWVLEEKKQEVTRAYAAARVRARSGHVGFVVEKVALRQVFSEYFGLAC
jgi:hypothetical protein